MPFIFFALRSSRQAKIAEGSLAVSLLRDSHNTYWTRTLWATETAMKSFMLSGAHRKVMPRLLDWCDEAAVVHWKQESDREPGWEEAHRRLQQEGRRSKVKHPSAAHEQFDSGQFQGYLWPNSANRKSGLAVEPHLRAGFDSPTSPGTIFFSAHRMSKRTCVCAANTHWCVYAGRIATTSLRLEIHHGK